jgi:hypothetical protein
MVYDDTGPMEEVRRSIQLLLDMYGGNEWRS